MTARSSIALLSLLGMLSAGMATGCSSLEGTEETGCISSDCTVRLIPVEDRAEPIDLVGDDLEGESISFADLRGRVVVVNVWGSWCGPCRVEQPDLVDAAEQTAGVADFVGINIRDSSADTALAFVRTNEVPYPSIYDPDSEALLTFSAIVPVRSPPTTFVLDSEGRIAAAIFGVLPTVKTLVDIVEDVAAEAPDETAGEPSG